jgi:hypothetical protein
MPAKITLITPPNIFQNDCLSVLFLDLTDVEQDEVSAWLVKEDINLNIYFYQGETNVPWVLHALSCADYKYINVNNWSAITSYLAGYILSKNNVFYSAEDISVADLYSYINNNRVKTAVDFLEQVFGGKK